MQSPGLLLKTKLSIRTLRCIGQPLSFHAVQSVKQANQAVCYTSYDRHSILPLSQLEGRPETFRKMVFCFGVTFINFS